MAAPSLPPSDRMSTYCPLYAKLPNKDPLPLNDLVDSYGRAYLAFLVNVHSHLVDSFLTSEISAKEIIPWVLSQQARGINMGVSLIDSPQEGCGWNECDIPLFIPTVVAMCRKYGNTKLINLDGDGPYYDFFAKLAPALKKALPDASLSVVLYGADGPLIAQLAPYIDRVMTMMYGSDVESNIALLQEYAKYYPDKSKLHAGVKILPGNTTSLAATYQIAKRSKELGFGPLMTWWAQGDILAFTGQPDNSWEKAAVAGYGGGWQNFDDLLAQLPAETVATIEREAASLPCSPGVLPTFPKKIVDPKEPGYSEQWKHWQKNDPTGKIPPDLDRMVLKELDEPASSACCPPVESIAHSVMKRACSVFNALRPCCLERPIRAKHDQPVPTNKETK